MNDETRKKISEGLKARWQGGKNYKMSEEARARMAKGHSERFKGWYRRKSPVREDEKNRLVAAGVNFRASDPRGQKGPLNHKALVWKLRSPEGKIYQFRNLAHFIRENEELFDPEDVVWKPVPSRPSVMKCLAYYALASLAPRRKVNYETRKGWRWHIDGQDPETLLSVLPHADGEPESKMNA